MMQPHDEYCPIKNRNEDCLHCQHEMTSRLYNSGEDCVYYATFIYQRWQLLQINFPL